MKYKSKTKDYLQTFFELVTTQFNHKIKQLRSDNRAEFLSNDMQSFFNGNGVVHQRSCMYTPQQNGVVERKHRHLLAVARAIRFQANLPLNFWGECILTAAYLINKIPTPLLSNRSPHELLLQSKPNYSAFRVFGCLCFARNTDRARHKFDPRAKPGVFVGYPYAQKGYRVYDLASKQIYPSGMSFFFRPPFHLKMLPFTLMTSPPTQYYH